MSARSLPSKPSLDHLKKQAKALHRAYQAGQAGAVARLRDALPKRATASDAEMLAAQFALLDAQRTIALEYGFDNWAALEEHVARMQGGLFSVLGGSAPGAKVLHFPADRAVGDVLIRPWGSPIGGGFSMDWDYLGFKHLAKAQGTVEVPAGQEARLSLAPRTYNLGAGLDGLAPDDLQYVTIDDDWNSQVIWTDDDCRHLARLKGLTWLSLVKASVTAAGLRWIGELTELRHLDLHQIELTDEGVAHLAGLRNIETFFGWGEQLTDASMAVFGGWGESLLEIRTGSDRITDEGMAPMAQCTRLRRMFMPIGITWKGLTHLVNLPLRGMVLCGNENIDDHALELLAPIWAQMPILDFLDLCDTPISDAGLPHLYGLRRLTQICVASKTRVTQAGVEALGRAMPYAEVY